ncbi:MAG: hypothetical protein HYR72_07860 [Deltaproteobacteria bacterium]|nr:hypothetical protein [Deltaproteobacteria bacterium]
MPPRVLLTVVSVLLLGPFSAHIGRAEIAADQAAAVVIFPYVFVDSANGSDTLLQLSNADTSGLDLQCFYENLNGHCSDSFAICQRDDECAPTGICLAGYSENNFRIHLTPGQPISWRASQGAFPLPCDAAASGPCGPGNDFNTGFIPSPTEDPFTGVLRCIAVDGSDLPVESNVIEGVATIEHFQSSPAVRFDQAKYNAIGIRAIAGAGDGDPMLNIGGAAAEYDGCPGVTVVTHLFENARAPATATSTVQTTLVLVPCSVDYVSQTPATVSVLYTVFNEFEQRLSTTKQFTGAQVLPLSGIHATLFDVATQGTLSGQTRIRPFAGGGVFVLALERHTDDVDATLVSTAAVNPHHAGAQGSGDSIVLPFMP